MRGDEQMAMIDIYVYISSSPFIYMSNHHHNHHHHRLLSEMEDWKLYVDAHIHNRYLEEKGLVSATTSSPSDYWNHGGIGLSIWRLPPDYDKSSKLLRPVGIRSLPIIDGK